ncbi:MAG: hypothetical protein MJZ37_01100 [Bacilli bacterium]|nr:hypothetical protein [Bacilli bacterium]
MKRNEMTKEQKKRNDFLTAKYEEVEKRAKELVKKGITKYQLFMSKSEHCETVALVMYNAKEYDLAAFYKSAADGFKEKARNLPVGAI